MSSPATLVSVERPCKAQERYATHIDEDHDMACCKGRVVPFGFGEAVHAGACCSDPECGDCDRRLVEVRVVAERNELLEAVRKMRDAYHLVVSVNNLALGEHGRGVVRAYFFDTVTPAESAITRAEGL